MAGSGVRSMSSMNSGPTIRDRQDAIQFLFGRLNYERVSVIPYQEKHFKLDRMRTLCERLGNPERQLAIVHVAGTKGKGSTSHMLESMARACGYRTGLYTSPHLVDVEERIVLQGQPCSASDLVELTRLIQPVVTAIDQEYAQSPDPHRGPTYFEILTAMALLHFAKSRVELAVIEVGLGGRLDSTNVCQPRCGIITSISRDHVRQLGSTLSAIAREKAGIIKPGVPLVSGVSRGPARTVITQTAAGLQSPVLQLGKDFRYVSRDNPRAKHPSQRSSVDYLEAGGTTMQNVYLGMLGRHQHANAAIALATRSVLLQQGWDLPEANCRRGLAEARGRARVELLQTEPPTIVDVAHNEASIDALLETLYQHWPDRRIIMVFAATRGKEIRAMLKRVLPAVHSLIITRYHENPRSESTESLMALTRKIQASHSRYRECCVLSEPDPRAAWERAQQLRNSNELICLTGSFFLAAEFLPIWSRGD